MKGFHVAVLFSAVLTIATAAFAQNTPPEFVITGDAARKIHDFTTINLATAERIAETCERLARMGDLGAPLLGRRLGEVRRGAFEHR